MNTADVVALGSPFSYQDCDKHLYRRSSKRKFDSLLREPEQEAFPYPPSPPMSTPPSPPGPPRNLTSNTSSETTPSVVATSAVLPVPALPTTLPGAQFAQLPPPVPPQYPHGFQGQIGGPGLPVPGVLNLGAITTPSPTVTVSPSVAGTGTARTGRKSRGHVASACINCKKAHLSCDIQRPCARCVASGKQDTCIDVQHKKRGRPRLREESEFKVEQMIPVPASQPPATFAGSPTLTRPIAGSRHRRTESLRSLRSQTSDSSGPSALPTPTFLPPPPGPPRFGLQQPPFPGPSIGAIDVPTAYLDLDLTFLRANNAFQQVMFGGQDVRGRRVDEVAASADANNFQVIRNQLREEREAREPSYMPPIVQQSQDPLQGVSDTDVEQITQGSRDRTYIWTPSQPSLSRERFTARVRLARTNTYFVVVTLPPIRQPAPPQPALLSSPYSIPATTAAQTYSPYGASTAYSAPPGYYGAQIGQPAAPSQQQPGPGQTYSTPYAAYYPPPYSYQPQQYLPPPTTPRMTTSGPPSEAVAYTSPTAPREPIPPGQPPLQLPPIVSAPPPAPGPSVSATSEQRPRRSSSEDDGDDEQSPKKRRRVGIHDVLQK